MDPKLLSSLIGSGSQLFGGILGHREKQAGLDEQKREFDTELTRKNDLMRPALPGMLSNLGYNSGSIPGVAAGMLPSKTPQKKQGGGFGHILGTIAKIGLPIAASALIPGLGGGLAGILGKIGVGAGTQKLGF